eukprot:c25408_g1_i1.p1 GENE.c25408_g1_i1~~c25408_g1_i1.p1  ORF type:complete len:449 (-),score=82.48 c25408_g1_i1:24-1370(-)
MGNLTPRAGLMAAPVESGSERSAQYEKLNLLGTGASGVVSLARRRRDGSTVVLKEIDMLNFTVKHMEHAVAEVRVLSTLNHPNIIRQEDSFVDGNVLIIIMEYAANGDLDSAVKNQRALRHYFAEAQVMQWFAQITAALAHCHHRMVLHRDLKAANILLDSENNVKLADFGLTSIPQHRSSLRETRVGTPYYMSPELARNQKYSDKNDIWALGVLLFRMCTLTYPFKGETMKELLRSIVVDPTPPLPEHFSADVQELLVALTAKDPNDRPTAVEVLRHPALGRALADLDLGTTMEIVSGNKGKPRSGPAIADAGLLSELDNDDPAPEDAARPSAVVELEQRVRELQASEMKERSRADRSRSSSKERKSKEKSKDKHKDKHKDRTPPSPAAPPSGAEDEAGRRPSFYTRPKSIQEEHAKGLDSLRQMYLDTRAGKEAGGAAPATPARKA